METPMNPMLEPRIGKVVVNICTGKSGEILEKAGNVLRELTGGEPCMRRAKRTLRAFGIRKGEPITYMVTLRGEKAEEFLRKALAAVEGRIRESSFEENGNFAFGIKEHIDIPGTIYNPQLGIFGMNVDIGIDRPGYRVARRRRRKSKVGPSHRVRREEAIEFIRKRFGAEVVKEVE
jgi:large subunit ribosomal protein L5